MRMVVRYSPRRAFRRLQYLLLACAVSLLGYCGFVLTDGWMFQHRERSRFEQQLRDREAAGALRTASLDAPESPKHRPPMADGLIGRIEIQRLGLSAMVTEGTSTATLRRAAGHIKGMALPGQPGNIGIAGHRDTFFRPLRNVRPDDVITLTTLLGVYRYRVVFTKVVSPDDVAVLDTTGDEVLTLITCYPFYFVGPAPDRFVVRADRI